VRGVFGYTLSIESLCNNTITVVLSICRGSLPYPQARELRWNQLETQLRQRSFSCCLAHPLHDVSAAQQCTLEGDGRTHTSLSLSLSLSLCISSMYMYVIYILYIYIYICNIMQWDRCWATSQANKNIEHCANIDSRCSSSLAAKAIHVFWLSRPIVPSDLLCLQARPLM